MRPEIRDTYSRAGRARRSGRGLVMEIAGGSYFLPPEEIPLLVGDQVVEVIGRTGEQEGVAWLSPMVQPKKHELTALIERQVYVLPVREMERLLSGAQSSAVVREYQSRFQ
ncbi:MAG: hypothetical protein LUQ25_00435 [Methanoregulaceae archaeon]|nr:hypothetical protein [Methanoregulaceae archaeon]